MPRSCAKRMMRSPSSSSPTAVTSPTDAPAAAAAAAAAGASVGLVTAVGDDELGERIIRFAHERGIDTTYVDRRPEPTRLRRTSYAVFCWKKQKKQKAGRR